MKKKTIWEKWVDPLNNNLDEVEWPGFNVDEDGEEYEIDAVQPMKIMQTPFGMMSMMNNSLLGNSFDFWILHTNFNIIPDLAFMINELPGVESLEVFTRYRARVGFPKSGLFDPSKVMRSIDAAIKKFYKNATLSLLADIPEDFRNEIVNLKEDVDDRYDNWTILILPNGKTEVLASNEADLEYENQQKVLIDTKNAINGHIMVSTGEIF